MPDERPPAARRHRRAVGPPGARPPAAGPGTVVGLGSGDGRRTDDEPSPIDDDERLRQEVPPHHGS